MIINISNSEKLKIIKEKLIIQNSDEEKEIALKDIKAIILQNHKTSITVATLLKLNEYKILTIFCNEKKQPQLQILDLYSNYKVTERIKEQIKWRDKEKRNCFKEIIKVKLHHQKELLEFLEKQEEANYLGELLEKLRVNKILDPEGIRAIEGVGARVYFQGLFGVNFKRFESDIENMGLNYGYTLIRTMISKLIVAKGLHPSLGVEHKSILNNFNLSDDLIEIYRPMVDYIVYLYVSSYEEFTWECKQKLLEVLYQKIKYQEKYFKLEDTIEKYIDEIIGFMNRKNKKINFPKLEIDKYEY